MIHSPNCDPYVAHETFTVPQKILLNFQGASTLGIENRKQKQEKKYAKIKDTPTDTLKRHKHNATIFFYSAI